MMKLGRPWNVEGVRSRARETAQEAARRSGMSVGEWLDSVIIDQAADQGVFARGLNGDEDPHLDHALADINDRLAALMRQVSRLGQVNGTPYAKPDQPSQAHGKIPQQLLDIITRLDNRVEQVVVEGRIAAHELERRVASLDQALSNLANQRMPGEAASLETGAHDHSTIEQQLRQLVSQIDTIARPDRIDELVQTLRQDLVGINQTLAQAMPRHAIEAIEKEVRGLTERLDAGRHSDVEAAALADLERRLAEIRDALRDFTPAESLIEIEHTVQALMRKVDLITASNHDPNSLRQIDAAIASLQSVASRVASSEALATLANDVRALAEKLEADLPARNDIASNLDRRIAAIADALEAARIESNRAIPAGFDAMMQSLSEKFERMVPKNDVVPALGPLEARIAKLLEKLDASDERLSHLGAIEQGMAGLTTQLEELRASGSGLSGSGTANESVETIKQAVIELKRTQATVERQTQDCLEAVHGTIDDVVSRLATIESELRQATRAPESREDTGLASLLVVPTAQAASAPSPTPLKKFSEVLIETSKSARPVSQPSPSPSPSVTAAVRRGDAPLEPGTGASRFGSTANQEIADQGTTHESGTPDADAAPRADFIAAARRAAQMAASAHHSGGDSTVQLRSARAVRPAFESKTLAQRVKSLFAGAKMVLAIAVVLGAGSGYLALKQRIAGDARLAHVQQGVKGDKNSTAADPPDSIKLPGEMAGSPAISPASAQSPSPQPSGPAGGIFDAGAPSIILPNAPRVVTGPAPAIVPNLNSQFALTRSPQFLMNSDANAFATSAAKPTERAPSAASNGVNGTPEEITGTVSPSAPSLQEQLTPAAKPAVGAKYPTSINGTVLQARLVAGDPSAAYEMGARFAEGRGVAIDPVQAAQWFDRAAKAGSAPAMFRLAAWYEKGEGGKKDLQAARRLYLAAADKGHAKAMHNLAVLYADGIDGKSDYKTAAHWFQRAANYGIADSQYNLGILYARGVGIERNLSESYKWFALAAAQGDQDAARKCDEVAAQLDPATLATARHAVQVFVRETQPEAATTVSVPPGGWDRAATTTGSLTIEPEIRLVSRFRSP